MEITADYDRVNVRITNKSSLYTYRSRNDDGNRAMFLFSEEFSDTYFDGSPLPLGKVIQGRKKKNACYYYSQVYMESTYDR